jgi:hypothetical protein
MDGAALVSVQTAINKAYAAAAIGMPTHDFYAAIEADAAAVASYDSIIDGRVPVPYLPPMRSELSARFLTRALRGDACGPCVPVAHIDAQPAEVVAQNVYLAQQGASLFIAKVANPVAFLVKKSAIQQGHLDHQGGPL